MLQSPQDRWDAMHPPGTHSLLGEKAGGGGARAAQLGSLGGPKTRRNHDASQYIILNKNNMPQ